MRIIFLTLYFDEETEQAVRDLWHRIAEAGVEMPGLKTHRPHITLAAYETDDIQQYSGWTEAFVATQPRLPLRFVGPGVFLEANTVFLAPHLTNAWFEMHTRLLTHLTRCGADPLLHTHYVDIGIWTPHCTLIPDGEPAAARKVIAVCQEHWRPVEGYAEGIGLAALPETRDYSRHPFTPPQSAGEYVIRLARVGDLPRLPSIEQAAASRFAQVGLAAVAAMESIAPDLLLERQEAGQLWVAATAAGEVAGFAMVDMLEAEVYLEELSVHPEHGQRGVGKRLTEFVCTWAKEQGAAAVVLSTFKDVAWNAPFYTKLGFVELGEDGLTSSLLAIRAAEAAAGLDVERRVFMRKVV